MGGGRVMGGNIFFLLLFLGNDCRGELEGESDGEGGGGRQRLKKKREGDDANTQNIFLFL